MYAENSFITLTYDDEHLPLDWSLDKEHLRNFWKMLRKQIYPKKIRYFACGEYGANTDVSTVSTLGRPHYHAIVFNHAWPDQEQISTNHRGDPLYTSESLKKTWGKGLVSIGEVTFASAAYVARYCTKKITGEEAEDHYSRTDPVTGEITYVRPEFVAMSTGRKKGEGIGGSWFKRYKSDLHKDFVTYEGVKNKVPRYYTKLMSEFDEDRAIDIKRNRENNIDSLDPDYTLDRLRVKEQIQEHKAQQLKRNLDHD